MKKSVLLLTLFAGALPLTGCLSSIEQVYLRCNDTGAKEISTTDTSGSIDRGWWGNLVTRSSTESNTYDCDRVLAKKEVKKSLKDKGYLKSE